MDLPEKEMRKLRGGVDLAHVPGPVHDAEPAASLRGAHRGDAPGGRRPMVASRSRDETRRRLAEVGIDDPLVAQRYPFQLSGGMRQRVALAAALARDPDLLIADEPSTALDVTTQAEILDLLRSVHRARGMGLILITHDLRVAFTTCDRVYVLYAGSLLEVGHAEALEREPLHPYTLGLLLSEPSIEQKLRRPRRDPRLGPGSGRCRRSLPLLRSVPLGRRPLPRRAADARSRSSRDGAARASGYRRSEPRCARCALVSSVSPPRAPRSRTEDRSIVVEDVREDLRPRSGQTVQALKGVSLSIRPGECVGLVGESGSGKTTLGRCLVGLETPSSGRIEIDGIDASDYAALSEGRADTGSAHGADDLPGPVLVAESRGTRWDERLPRRCSDPASRARRGTAEAMPQSCWTGSAFPPHYAARSPHRSRVANASASRSPGPSPCNRSCSCATSRSRRSTCPCRHRS